MHLVSSGVYMRHCRNWLCWQMVLCYDRAVAGGGEALLTSASMLQVATEGQWVWVDSPTLADMVLAGRVDSETPARAAPAEAPRPLYSLLSTDLLNSILGNLSARIARADVDRRGELPALYHTVGELLTWPWPGSALATRRMLLFYRAFLAELLGRAEESLGNYTAFLVSVERNTDDLAQQVALNNRAVVAVMLGGLEYVADLLDLLAAPAPACHYAAANLLQIRAGAHERGWQHVLQHRLVRLLGTLACSEEQDAEPGGKAIGRATAEDHLTALWRRVAELSSRLPQDSDRLSARERQLHRLFTLLTRDRIPPVVHDRIGAAARQRWIAGSLVSTTTQLARAGSADIALHLLRALRKALAVSAKELPDVAAEVTQLEQFLSARRHTDAERRFIRVLNRIERRLTVLAVLSHEVSIDGELRAAEADLAELAEAARELELDGAKLRVALSAVIETAATRVITTDTVRDSFGQALRNWPRPDGSPPGRTTLADWVLLAAGGTTEQTEWEKLAEFCREADARMLFHRALTRLQHAPQEGDPEVQKLLASAAHCAPQWAEQAALVLFRIRATQGTPSYDEADPAAELEQFGTFFEGITDVCLTAPLLRCVGKLFVERVRYLCSLIPDRAAVRRILRQLAQRTASALVSGLANRSALDAAAAADVLQWLLALCPDRFDLNHPLHDAIAVARQWQRLKEAEEALARDELSGAEQRLAEFFDSDLKPADQLAFALWLALQLLGHQCGVRPPDWPPEATLSSLRDALGVPWNEIAWAAVREQLERFLTQDSATTQTVWSEEVRR